MNAGPTVVSGEAGPLVSCLMVTRDRLALAKRSMRCFAAQSYLRRELVIVSEGDRAYRRALQHHLDEEGIDRARVVAGRPGATLGTMRNLSLDAATGEVVCQWDDDDCYHPDRILRQLEHMTRQQARACFLTDNLQWLEPDRQLFWLDWTRYQGAEDADGLGFFPPTLMMVRDERFRYPETGPRAHIGEDEDIAAGLCREVPVAMLSGMGWLYLYVFHGANTCSRDHHYRVAARRGASHEWITPRLAQIRRAVACYPIPGPVVVCGAGDQVHGLP